MRIKFKSPDPRAGTIAQMDSSRGQQLIDAGAAVRVKDEDAKEAPAEVLAIPIEAEKVTAPAKRGKK